MVVHWRRSVAAGLLIMSAACTRREEAYLPGTGHMRGANVLLVTIDTLRRDRVGAYGNAGGLTPTLDRLAASGVRYTRAFSHVPMTLPAHTSIMTGLTPRRHGVRNNTNFRLGDRVPTLAVLLKRAGYRTGAFVGAFVLDARFGLNQGFDEYNDRLPHHDRASFHFAERRAADVAKVAGDWILQPSAMNHEPSAISHQPWFAWVHLFDPHAPYDAPAEYRPGRSPYDAEIAYADAALGQFLDRLRAAHVLDRTLIIITADHGESLGEHGETTHGLFAYDATMAVPLIVSGPSVHAGVADAPVAHSDIAPTILDLVGAPIPEGIDGQSLVRSPSRDRAVYFEALDAYLTRGWAPLSGIIQGGWKYIDVPEPELYDLSADPSEQHNRAGRDAHGEALQRILASLAATSEGAGAAASLDRDAAARLRSLGYVGTRVTSGRRTFTLADDPKRLIPLSERFNAALTAFDGGRSEEALSAFLSILRDRADFAAARTSAATVLLARGDSRGAVQLLREAPADQEGSGEILAKLGLALRDSGDMRGAAAALERARQTGDESADLLNDLAVVYAGLGRSTDARNLFREIISRSPSAATAWYNLGLFELQSRQRAEAADAMRRAVAIEPAYGDAWQALGAAVVDADRTAAIDAWRNAERLLPRDYDLLFNLSMLLVESDTPSVAIPYLRRFVAEAPPAHYAKDVARVRTMLTRLERGSS